MAVYDNLIAAVRNHLPAVHAYFDMRRRKMKLEDIHHYDTYVPILAESKTHRSWDQAVAIVMDSLRPLGQEYCRVLEGGCRVDGPIGIRTPASKAGPLAVGRLTPILIS